MWGENLEDYPGPHVQVIATRSLVAAKQTKGNQLQIQQQKKKIAKVAAKQTKPLKQKQALKPNGAKNKKMIFLGLICKVVYLKYWKTAHLDAARHLIRTGVKTC